MVAFFVHKNRPKRVDDLKSYMEINSRRTKNGGQKMAEEPQATPAPDDQEPTVEFNEAQQAKVNAIVEREKAKASKSATKGMFTAEDVQQQVKDELAKQQALADEKRKVDEMSEKDKQNYQIKQMQEQLDKLAEEKAQLETDKLQSQLTSQASKILAEKGIAPDERTLKFIVKSSADETQSAIDDFVSLIDEKAELKRQAGLTGRTPRVSGGTEVKNYTIQEFMKLTSNQQAEFRQIGRAHV